MRHAHGYAEVVCVIEDFRLVDAESYERTYTSANGRPLVRGYYVARWPVGTRNPHFLHDGLAFDGPYVNRRAAEAALDNVEPTVRAA